MASPFVNPFRGHGLLGLLALLAGLVAYVGLGTWLLTAASWPSTCDYDGGTRLARLFNALSCSPELLAGGMIEYGLFAWLWSLPIGLGAIVLVNQLGRRPAVRSNSPE